MAVSASHVDVLLSLRDGFERFAIKTDEIGRVLETELRHLLEEWDERVQKARAQERDRQDDLSNAQRDLRWCLGTGVNGSQPNCSYEQARVEKAGRALVEAQVNLQLVSRCARELQTACEAFQKHGRALRQIATQTAPSASSHVNTLLRDVERYSHITSTSNISHVPTSNVSLGVPPLEEKLDAKIQISEATYQSRLSSSMRELAALLCGQSTPTSLPDTTLTELACHQLRSLEELTPEVWANLLEPQRIAALSSVERIMAELQGRPATSVNIESADRSTYGSYDPQTDCISLSQWFVLGGTPHKILEAVIHMGRHAYQAHAMRHPTFHFDADEVGRWRINNLYYLRADVWGDEAYRNQPVERDAFAYVEAVIRQLYGNGEENPNE